MLVQLSAFVAAAEPNDVFVAHFEVDKLLNLGSALISTGLCVLTLYAYKRSKNKRLLFVSAAFLLFALKGYLLASEIIFGDWGWTDIAGSVLDFGILLTFFMGFLKK